MLRSSTETGTQRPELIAYAHAAASFFVLHVMPPRNASASHHSWRFMLYVLMSQLELQTGTNHCAALLRFCWHGCGRCAADGLRCCTAGSTYHSLYQTSLLYMPPKLRPMHAPHAHCPRAVTLLRSHVLSTPTAEAREAHAAWPACAGCADWTC